MHGAVEGRGNLPQPRVLLPHAYSTRIANTIPYLPTRVRVSHAELPGTAVQRFRAGKRTFGSVCDCECCGLCECDRGRRAMMGAAETAATGRTAASSMASADEWRRQIQFVHLRSCPTRKNLEHSREVSNELDSASLTQPSGHYYTKVP